MSWEDTLKKDIKKFRNPFAGKPTANPRELEEEGYTDVQKRNAENVRGIMQEIMNYYLHGEGKELFVKGGNKFHVKIVPESIPGRGKPHSQAPIYHISQNLFGDPAFIIKHGVPAFNVYSAGRLNAKALSDTLIEVK